MRKRLLELLDELKKELGEDNDLDADTQKELEEVADALDDYSKRCISGSCRSKWSTRESPR